jgi:hypothetical protein
LLRTNQTNFSPDNLNYWRMFKTYYLWEKGETILGQLDPQEVARLGLRLWEEWRARDLCQLNTGFGPQKVQAETESAAGECSSIQRLREFALRQVRAVQ